MDTIRTQRNISDQRCQYRRNSFQMQQNRIVHIFFTTIFNVNGHVVEEKSRPK